MDEGEDNDDEDSDGFLLIESNGGSPQTKPPKRPSDPPRTTTPSGAHAGDMRLELISPPRVPPATSEVVRGQAEDPVEAALLAGVAGSRAANRAAATASLLTLVTASPKPGEAVDKERRQQVLDLCSHLHLGFAARLDVFLTYKPGALWRGAYFKVKPSVSYGLSDEIEGDPSGLIEASIGGAFDSTARTTGPVWSMKSRSMRIGGSRSMLGSVARRTR